MEDKRFAHVATDPKFRRYPKSKKKVKIDRRFKGMFNGKQFKANYKVDSRGRPINRTATASLKTYYQLSSENSSSEEEDEKKEPGKYVKAPEDSVEKTVTPEDSDEKSLAPEDSYEKSLGINNNDVKVSDAVKKKLRNLKAGYARGKARLFSESSSDESETDASGDDDLEHKWGELDADAERTDEITHRLAACNMDWDRIRAVDLMVLFNSFVPQGGVIKSVNIYPSEFGIQRLKEENIKGPSELVEAENDDAVTDEENEEGSKYHMEKLRQYQLNRLKYYYAVVKCDSSNTANKIYSDCDGMEYESSATKMDLRFIPDDMIFDQEPKEFCDKVPETTKYEPRFFTTTALQQAKVDLTWDETNPARIETMKKLSSGKIDDVDHTDIQAYLASNSDTDEELFEKKDSRIDKYRALLDEIDAKEREKEESKIEMQVSWGVDLQEKTDKLMKDKMLDMENKTPFQQYLEKRKDKRKEKREERKNKVEEDRIESSGDSDVPSDVDMNDPYFAEEFDKEEFKSKKKPKATNANKSTDNENQAELELLLMNGDDKKHFDLKKIQDQQNESKSKKKRKNKQVEDVVDDFEVNVNDERFSALYTSHHFNIDPTDSHYKKTKATEKLINEKLKRRNVEVQQDSKKPKLSKDTTELNVLVKSVKRKAPHALVNKKS